MKRLAFTTMLVLALVAGSVSVGTAAGRTAHAAAAKTNPKKKCKKGRTFRKGKCRRVQLPPPLGAPHPPNSIVRASVSWDAPAYVYMQVNGAQGRAGFFPGEGVLNEIPNAHYSGGTGGPGPETDTFTDDLFYGGYGYIWYPSPGNRGFGFTFCERGTAGPDPVHVSAMWVETNGLVDRFNWTLPSDAIHSCVGY